jgi:hypothetical protein
VPKIGAATHENRLGDRKKELFGDFFKSLLGRDLGQRVETSRFWLPAARTHFRSARRRARRPVEDPDYGGRSSREVRTGAVDALSEYTP